MDCVLCIQPVRDVLSLMSTTVRAASEREYADSVHRRKPNANGWGRLDGNGAVRQVVLNGTALATLYNNDDTAIAMDNVGNPNRSRNRTCHCSGSDERELSAQMMNRQTIRLINIYIPLRLSKSKYL